MAITVVVTNAGRAALINAQATGTAPVTIAKVGVSSTAVVPAPAMTVLAGELKRISTIGGGVTSPATIHVSMRDETADAYSLRSFGLYLADNTLFAVYGQADPIFAKTVSSVGLLAVDIQFADIAATDLTFGATNFLNPDATTEVKGLVELATDAEVAAKTDAVRAVTAKSLWFAFSAWIAAAFSDVWRASNDGAGSGMDADLLDGQQGAYYADIAGRLGYPPANRAGDTFTGAIKRDAGFGMDLSAGNPIHNYDTGDYAYYDRTGNTYYWLSGGVTQAYLNAAGQYIVRQAVLINSNIAWHAGNDGAGSGLDADMLDGLNSTAFARRDGSLNTPVSQGVVLAGDQAYDTQFSPPLQIREVNYVGTGNTTRPWAPGICFHWAGVTSTSIKMLSSGALVAGATAASPTGETDFYAKSFFASGQIVWHAGNDGAGSGLDADQLDGQDGSYYSNVPARLGYPPVNRAGDIFTGPFGRDASFYFELSGGHPVTFYDVGDYAYFNRATNVYSLNIAGNSQFAVEPSGWAWARIGITVSGNVVWHAGNDGAGSGLDADLLDGQDGSYYSNITARLGYTPLNTASYTPGDVLAKLVTVDGAGSGLDADLLDGRQAAEFALLSQFANLLNTNGYQKLPGGLIIQWGYVFTVGANASEARPVNWPIEFPNACLFAGAFQSDDVGGSLERSSCSLWNRTRFGALVRNNATYNATIGFFAIGN